MSGKNEYEVESIIRARVDRGKGRKSVWKYCVKWKGYGEEDNTWEPFESFEGGSEQIIDRFWQRANTGGRDAQNLDLFQVGEEFYPIGPPRRKGKPKRPAEQTQTMPSQSSVAKPSSKRRRSSSGVVTGETDGPPPKRRGRQSDSGIASQRVSGKSLRKSEERSSGPRGSHVAPIPLHPKRKRVRRLTSDVEDSEDEIMRLYLAEPSESRPSDKEDSAEPSREQKIQSNDVRNLSAPVDPVDNKVQSNYRMRQDSWIIDSTTPGASQSEQMLEVIPPDSPLFDGSDCDSPEHVEKDVVAADESSTGPRLTSTSSHSIPLHRVRAANPLVKMVDSPNFHGMEGAIAVKARILRNHGKGEMPLNITTPGSGPSSRVPQKKNTSSLLTFQKGSLKMVKGKYSSLAKQQCPDEEVNIRNWDLPLIANGDQGHGNIPPNADATGELVSGDIPGLHNNGSVMPSESAIGEEILQVTTPDTPAPPLPLEPAPTGEELLQMAGLDAQIAEDLPDFEEDPPAEQSNEPQDESQPAKTLQIQSTLERAKDRLFPTGLSLASATNAVNAAWKRSTIFGPLGLGTDIRTVTAKNTLLDSAPTSTRAPFLLVLDSSVSIPVVLKDVSSHGSLSLDSIVSKCPKGPPGKFYHNDFALALLDTVQPAGSFARIVPEPSVNEGQEQHFHRFRGRLEGGELFVAMAGVEVLAFCSSQNVVLGQRLRIPSVLLGLPATVIVSRVVIANHSAYADAAVKADNVRW